MFSRVLSRNNNALTIGTGLFSFFGLLSAQHVIFRQQREAFYQAQKDKKFICEEKSLTAILESEGFERIEKPYARYHQGQRSSK